MGKRPSRRGACLAVAGGVLLCLVLFAGAAGFLLLRQQTRPEVLIGAPQFGDQVSTNELTVVQAVARDPQGVVRLELWVDGELLTVQTSQLPEGSTPFPLAEGWQPQGAGLHTLVVRAYNRALESGQATVLVEAQDLPETPHEETYQIQEGDTLQGVAANYDLAAEDILGANPGLSEPLMPGEIISVPPPPPGSEDPARAEAAPAEPLPGEGPPDPSAGRETPLIARLLPVRWTARPSDPRLEVELLSLETGEDYDGVYCYFSLAGEPFERVPASGYLEAVGERQWAIEQAMAGERRRVIVLAEGSERLDIQGHCLGYRASTDGGEVLDLGTPAMTSLAGEWDGRETELTATGRDDWVRVGYRVTRRTGLGPPPFGPGVAEVWPEGDAPSPVLVKECTRRYIGVLPGEPIPIIVARWFIECTVWVDPSSVPVAVDGFLFLRNGALYHQLAHPRSDPAGMTMTSVSPPLPAGTRLGTMLGVTGDLPPMGETWEYQVIAYRGDPFADPPAGYRSPPSNTVSIGSEIWPEGMNVRVTFYELDMGCLHADTDLVTNLGGIGPREVDEEGHPIITGCDEDLEGYGGGTYGGPYVNGTQAFYFRRYLHSGGRYDLLHSILFYNPSVELYLGPGDWLTISLRLYDYDVFSDDDPYCHDEAVYNPEELAAIRDGPGGRFVVGQAFWDDEGDCYLTYDIIVLP